MDRLRVPFSILSSSVCVLGGQPPDLEPRVLDVDIADGGPVRGVGGEVLLQRGGGGGGDAGGGGVGGSGKVGRGRAGMGVLGRGGADVGGRGVGVGRWGRRVVAAADWS